MSLRGAAAQTNLKKTFPLGPSQLCELLDTFPDKGEFCCCWRLLLGLNVVVGGCCCWGLLFGVHWGFLGFIVGCCWGLLLRFVVGGCCWRLLLEVVVGVYGGLLLQVVFRDCCLKLFLGVVVGGCC